jgi:hypothetical protein
MKIVTSDEIISVESARENKFRATVAEITEVRVMADKAIPKTLRARFSHYFRGSTSEIGLRAIIVWAGDRSVTLDAYYDERFDAAVEWFSRHGWDMQRAVTIAVLTPLVRVNVQRT